MTKRERLVPEVNHKQTDFVPYYVGFAEEIRQGSGLRKDDFGVVWNRSGVDKDIGVINEVLEKG